MNCNQACECIKPFIEGSIDDDKLAGFLEHVNSCKSCYEELDIMYIVSEGLEGLKGDAEGDFDFSGMLSQRLIEEGEYLKSKHSLRIAGTAVSLMAFISLAFVSLRFFGII